MKLQTKCAILLCAVFGLSGCADEQSPNETPHRVFPAFEGGAGGDQSGPCSTEITTVDALINTGRFHFAYGTIERVEPVLELFNYNGPKYPGQPTCDGNIEPGVRVFLKIQNASWSWADNPVIEIGFQPDAFYERQAEPYYSRKDGLFWSDGKTYFAPGDTLGVTGAFTEDGYFLSLVNRLFEVSENQTIEGYGPISSCHKGEMNGRDVDQVIAQVVSISGTDKPYMTPPLHNPLHSYCLEGDSE